MRIALGLVWILLNLGAEAGSPGWWFTVAGCALIGSYASSVLQSLKSRSQ